MEGNMTQQQNKLQPQQQISTNSTLTVNLRALEHFKWKVIYPVDYSLRKQETQNDKYETGDGDFNQDKSQPFRRAITEDQIQQQLIPWEISWFDNGGLTPEILSTLLPWQRVNHFLGMYNIARKNTLGIHLKRFQKEFPKHYNFFPQTWLYPSDFYDIIDFYNQKLNKRKQKIADGKFSGDPSQPVVLFICKPEASSQGKGIFLVKRIEDLRQQLNQQFQIQQKQLTEFLQAQENYDTAFQYSSIHQRQIQYNADGTVVYPEGLQPPQQFEKNNSYVVQKYLKNPALINDHKFDFRIYVLVTSVIEYPTIFIYNDGLVRLASEKYSMCRNIQDVYVHLTNYSLNKKNEHFDGNKHKLRLSDILNKGMSSSTSKGSYTKSKEILWKEIEDIVIKTVITIQPQLQSYYRSCQPKEPDLCYELLGFDIMMDAKLKPWLLEVNHLPSFNSDTPTDEKVKYDLVQNIFAIEQLSVEMRKKVYQEMKIEQKQALQAGVYKRLSVKEHVDKVRFDPTLVEKMIPNNRFKLIYPQDSIEVSYDRFQRKAHEIWQVLTGTLKQPPPSNPKKKKLKHKNRKQSQIIQNGAPGQEKEEIPDGQESKRKESDSNDEKSSCLRQSTNNCDALDVKMEENLNNIASSAQEYKEYQIQSVSATSSIIGSSPQTFFDKRQPSSKVSQLQQPIQVVSVVGQPQGQVASAATTNQYQNYSKRQQFRSQIKPTTGVNNNLSQSVVSQVTTSISQNSQQQQSSQPNNQALLARQQCKSSQSRTIINSQQRRTIEPYKGYSIQSLQQNQSQNHYLNNLQNKNIGVRGDTMFVDIEDKIDHHKATPQIQNNQNTDLLEQKAQIALYQDQDIPGVGSLSNNQLKYKDFYKTNRNEHQFMIIGIPNSQGNDKLELYPSSFIIQDGATSCTGAQSGQDKKNQNAWFLNKLKSVIQHQFRGAAYPNQYLMYNQKMHFGSPISPGGSKVKLHMHQNNFYNNNKILQNNEKLRELQSRTSKEELLNSAMHQRVVVKTTEHVFHKPIVDLAPINLSAGIIDKGVQIQKKNYQKSLASSNRQTINKGANKPNVTKRESNQSNSVAPATVLSTSKDQKGHKSPKQQNTEFKVIGEVPLLSSANEEFINASQTALVLEDFESTGFNHDRGSTLQNKMEQKQRQLLTMETQQRSLEKLREYEKRLLSKAISHSYN